MSKKRSKKQKFKATLINTINNEVKETKEENNEFKKDFMNLAISIGFIVLILVSLYYFDQKDSILETYMQKLFSSI